MAIIEYLFDTSIFFPRSHCGAGWTDTTILADNLANGLIFAAYIAIPLGLLLMHSTLRRIPLFGELPKWVLVSFAAFILFCGFAHLWEIVVFHKPAYRFFILWNWLTGIASWVAVYGVFLAVQKLQTLHTQEEIDLLVGGRDQAAKEKVEAQVILREEIARKGRQQQKLQDELNELRDVATRMEHDAHLKELAKEIREKLHRIRNAAQ